MGHALNGFATRLVVALQFGFLIQWRRSRTDGIISRHNRGRIEILTSLGAKFFSRHRILSNGITIDGVCLKPVVMTATSRSDCSNEKRSKRKTTSSYG